MARLELDHNLAKEWHYGIDKHNPVTNEPCTLWKRLPLHIVCAGSSNNSPVPLGLVHLLIKVYPQGLRSVDPHTGMIPLHLACRSCGRQPAGPSRNNEMAVVMLQVIRLGLQVYPHSTKALDVAGRSPLHHAVMVGAPMAVIDILVHKDPGSVLCPDQNGFTPLCYAQEKYAAGEPVMSVLELLWL
jgi:ankyrin repeat protein